MLSPTRDARALQTEMATLMAAWDGEEARGVAAFRKGRLQWSLPLTSVTPAGDFGDDEMRGLRRRLGVGTPEEAEAALRERQEAEIETVQDRFEDVSRVAARFGTTAEMGIEDGRGANSKYAWIAVDVNRRHLVSPHRGATAYHDVSGMLVRMSGYRSTPARRERVKDWRLERQRESNEVPPFEKVLALLKASDGWADMLDSGIAFELGSDWGLEVGSPEWKESLEEQFTDEQRERYDRVLWEMDDLDGKDVWRMLTLREGVDPRTLAGVGEYWADDPALAEAHWGDFRRSMRKVLLRARIDSENIDRAGMMLARMDLSTGEEEREVRFLKHAPIWVRDATLDDGTVVGINGWRRA